MGTEVLNPINSIVNGFLNYLPSLLAGIGLLLLGLLCGWIVKRIIIQFAAILRLDRLLSRSRWKDQFKKADVRFGLSALAGNIGFALILLIFIDNAFIAWKLTVLSNLLGAGIQFLPRLIIAATSVLILGRHAFFESGSTEEEDKR
ncbi:MAG: mechanosensitive ion channel family protein [Rectinemataceae bacterium]